MRRSRLADVPRGRVNILTDDEDEENNDILEEKKSEKALVVKDVSTRADNEKLHKTEEFERKDAIILRRGQEFSLNITFDRQINTENDMVMLQLAYGTQPRDSKGTLVRFPLNLHSTDKTTDIGRSWSVSATLEGSLPTSVSVNITSPPDAFIGYYRLFVVTKQKGENDITRTENPKRIIMLFNPWCKDDTVYMEKEEERQEYILSEEGFIWIGSAWRNWPKPWNFGQFEKPVLNAALMLLYDAELMDEGRNNPITISRKMSALVNMNNDNGILWGRWSKPYSSGTPPTSWTGSVPIIKEFFEKQRSVRYGQCWVFAGVLTTVLRALGIPTRPVTNFASAHDHDLSMTIDRYLNEEGETLKSGADSVWNFHVWNECWFKRNDLPSGYDGWQVLDATPQELSDGVMQCGPASVRAVKEGHVYLYYDVPFVYAEVNGDVIYWTKHKDRSPDTVANVNKHEVGWNISTKAVGSEKRHDLTGDYKYFFGSDDSHKEDEVRAFVNRFSTRRVKNIYSDFEPEKEIEVELLPPTNELFGEDFQIVATIKNTEDKERRVSAGVTLFHCYYTGVPGKYIKKEHFEETIAAGQKKIKIITVTFDEYKSIDNPEGRFQLFFTAKNVSTGRVNVREKCFVLNKPEIGIEIPERVDFGMATDAVVKFKNTTSIMLTDCKFHVESIGSLDKVTLTRQKPLDIEEEWSETVVLKPYKETKNYGVVVAMFESEELVGVEGRSTTFKIVHRQPESDH